MSALSNTAAQQERFAANRWLRALELTAPIPRRPARILPRVVDELAQLHPDAQALLSDRECFTYGTLHQRVNQYARWAWAQNIHKGDVVGLLMPNRPEYFAIWLGITSIGGVVALLNTNLTGRSLAHCIDAAAPTHLMVAAEWMDVVIAARQHCTQPLTIWVHGQDDASYPRVDTWAQQLPSESLDQSALPFITVQDLALYIYTSGTTGLPKAAKVNHGRILQWSYWFSGLADMQPHDRTYSCLPMYHSIGGVLVPGMALVSSSSVVLAEKFSASQFWGDVSRWSCTVFQYIGELCRYLVQAPAHEPETRHDIRLACGNGLTAEVWEQFQRRFAIPRILEFYASTEGGVSLFNVEGRRGAVGRIPPYLGQRSAPALIRLDPESGEPLRDADGFCIRCAPGEAGEAIGPALNTASDVGSRFEGYSDPRASAARLLHNVFRAGDTWVRTGDLMRMDEKGFFYFVDRVGDTFRWKGENVATTEVSEILCAFPGVRHANVYGVAIPAMEGRAGMAALVAEGELEMASLRSHLAECLPRYARPLFLRLRDHADLTATFKYSKTELMSQGYDPGRVRDALYFDSPDAGRYIPLDHTTYERIQTGQIRI